MVSRSQASRSAADIVASYQHQPWSGTQPRLVASWRFDEGAGLTAVDAVHGYVATLAKGASFSPDVHP